MENGTTGLKHGGGSPADSEASEGRHSSAARSSPDAVVPDGTAFHGIAQTGPAPTGTAFHGTVTGAKLPKIIPFTDLCRCGDEVWIEHDGQLYRLRRTRLGKLILTK
ncbi:MAG: hemin uptake protein HemP [Pirellula sp.]|jgi:hemin uptake protein HemP